VSESGDDSIFADRTVEVRICELSIETKNSQGRGGTARAGVDSQGRGGTARGGVGLNGSKPTPE